MKAALDQIPEGSFWDLLNSKVAEIGQRTRCHQRNTDLSEPKFSRRSRLSRFGIETQYLQEKEEEQKIVNRIKFLQTEKERRDRALELAKVKYEKVMKIRNESFRQKKEIKQKTRAEQKKITRNASIRVSLAKQIRQKVSLSVQRIREEHDLSARAVRSSSLQLEENLRTSRQIQNQQKRELVEKMHKTLEFSRLHISQQREEKTEKARMECQQFLKNKLKVNEVQHRRNSLLKQKLHDSLLAHSKDRDACLDKLKHYTTMTKQQNPSRCKFNSMQTTSC